MWVLCVGVGVGVDARVCYVCVCVKNDKKVQITCARPAGETVRGEGGMKPSPALCVCVWA